MTIDKAKEIIENIPVASTITNEIVEAVTMISDEYSKAEKILETGITDELTVFGHDIDSMCSCRSCNIQRRRLGITEL